MARKLRVDAPGALHHVVARGIDRGRIFAEPAGYRRFVRRLGEVLKEGGAQCLAWTLMPNHIHLVVRTGRIPLSRLMQKLLVGHAVSYNKARGRTGHVFEGRYKSILCEEEPYLLELVRYVHLNPVRARICDGLRGLARYRWSGHRALLGRADLPWQQARAVLERFGGSRNEARVRYLRFLEEGLAGDAAEGVRGESLRRLVEGGWEVVRGLLNPEAKSPDESIIGSERFIRKTLAQAEEQERWKSGLRRKFKPADVLARAARAAGIPVGDLKGGSKIPARCRGRALACYWLVDVLGLREVQVGRMLGITQSAVSINVRKGKGLAEEEALRLDSPS